MRKITIILCLCCILTANAQVDSLAVPVVAKSQMAVNAEVGMTRKQYNLGYAHHSFCVALPMAVVGLGLIPLDKHISNGVQGRIPNLEMKFDDYIQYTPWAAHAVMGVCGVKGISKNRYQILVADAFAAVMMATMVNGLKYSINRRRPDGSNASFPSGHTATAFTGATLLAHEYGHRSIWIPVAGYTLASATGVMRVLNNRHYLSDVVVGAAVGILSAELAYWATDAIFKDFKSVKSRRDRVNYVVNNY